MNIIYKFTSKVTGKYYIGSKAECIVEGNNIIDTKTGKFYYTSTTSEELRNEFNLDNMILEVLEDNLPREKLIERESYWQNVLDYKSEKCYNKVDANNVTFDHIHKCFNLIYNKFGQTYIDFSKDESAVARKDSSAKRKGFDNYGHMTYELVKTFEATGSYATTDKTYGLTGFSKRYLKGISLKDFDVTLDTTNLIFYMRQCASFKLACELCGIKDYVARYILADNFEDLLSTKNYIAQLEGFTNRRDFATEVLRLYIKDFSINEISKKYPTTSKMTIRRLLDEAIKERIKISDLG